MIYDALEMSYRTVKIRKDPSTPKITELIDYDAFCGVVSDEAQDAAAGHTITAIELKEMIDAGKDFALIDVREPHEYEIVSIPGATLIPKDRIMSGEALSEIPQDKPVVLHCKSGVALGGGAGRAAQGRFPRRGARRRRRAGLGQAGRSLPADLLSHSRTGPVPSRHRPGSSSGVTSRAPGEPPPPLPSVWGARPAVTDGAAGACPLRPAAGR